MLVQQQRNKGFGHFLQRSARESAHCFCTSPHYMLKQRWHSRACDAPSSTADRVLCGVLKKSKPKARRQFLATGAGPKEPPAPCVVELGSD